MKNKPLRKSWIAGGTVRQPTSGNAGRVHVGDAANASTSRFGRRLSVSWQSTSVRHLAGSTAAAIDGLNRCMQDRLPTQDFHSSIVPIMAKLAGSFATVPVLWLDLCGNAKIILPGLRIWIEGRRNKYSERGRPSNLFALKSSRIARQLLLDPQRFQTQADLARQSGLATVTSARSFGGSNRSTTWTATRRERSTTRSETSCLTPGTTRMTSTAIALSRDMCRHASAMNYATGRNERSSAKLEWAVSGLSAAWLYTGFAAFRLRRFTFHQCPPAHY